MAINDQMLKEMSSYDLAMDTYCKLMRGKVNLGNEYLDLFAVIENLKFIASTDQHPAAQAMYADVLASDALQAAE